MHLFTLLFHWDFSLITCMLTLITKGIIRHSIFQVTSHIIEVMVYIFMDVHDTTFRLYLCLYSY